MTGKSFGLDVTWEGCVVGIDPALEIETANLPEAIVAARDAGNITYLWQNEVCIAAITPPQVAEIYESIPGYVLNSGELGRTEA